MKLRKYVIVAVSGVILWIIFIAFGIFENFLLIPFTFSDSPEDFIITSKEEIEKKLNGNLAMVLIEDGKIVASHFHAKDETIDGNTVFPVASISKWVTSWGIMKLVEEEKIDLDTPVDQYLTRWHIPEGEFDTNKVTIRRLLSHSSGLVDNLGYEGFHPREYIQTIEESLTNPADSDHDGSARLGFEPGSQYMYSGAGYTILQLVIEEVSGQTFTAYMEETIFAPLGMTNSTYNIELKPYLDKAKLYNREGGITKRKTFTALAAAGLNTTVNDLSKFLVANVTRNSILSPKTIKAMGNSETFINEIGVYGLGPHLYSQNAKDSQIIGHDGSGGSIAINSAARIDLMSKDGIIVLEMGNYGLASGLADEWLFWHSGIADYVVFMRNKTSIILIFFTGIIVIIGLAVFAYKRQKGKV